MPSNCIGSSITNGSFKAKMTTALLQEIYSVLGVEGRVAGPNEEDGPMRATTSLVAALI